MSTFIDGACRKLNGMTAVTVLFDVHMSVPKFAPLTSLGGCICNHGAQLHSLCPCALPDGCRMGIHGGWHIAGHPKSSGEWETLALSCLTPKTSAKLQDPGPFGRSNGTLWPKSIWKAGASSCTQMLLSLIQGQGQGRPSRQCSPLQEAGEREREIHVASSCLPSHCSPQVPKDLQKMRVKAGTHPRAVKLKGRACPV